MSKKKLSPSEQHVWEYMTTNVKEIPKMTLNSVAMDANVSNATVIRTLQKKGYKGYPDFKLSLDTKNTNISHNIFENYSYDIKQIILRNEREVIGTLNNIKIHEFQIAAKLIIDATRVIVFAQGFSAYIAEEIRTKLTFNGHHVIFFSDPDFITSFSDKLTDKDIILFISLSGETKEYKAVFKNIKDLNIKTIAITVNNNSFLSQHATVSLVGYREVGRTYPDYDVMSRLPLEIICRILIHILSVKPPTTITH